MAKRKRIKELDPLVMAPIKTEPPDPEDPSINVKVEAIEPKYEINTSIVETQCDISTQTTINISEQISNMNNLRSTISTMTHYQKRLQDKINRLENSKEISQKDFLKYCKNHFNSTFFEIIKTQFELSQTVVNGERYSNEFKKIALELFSTSPLAYEKLNKTMRFPSKTTLFRWKADLNKKHD